MYGPCGRTQDAAATAGTITTTSTSPAPPSNNNRHSRCYNSKNKTLLSLSIRRSTLELLLLTSQWRCRGQKRARAPTPPPIATCSVTFALPPPRCCGSYRVAAAAAPTVVTYASDATVRNRVAIGYPSVVYGVSCSGLGCIRKLAASRICGGD